jgi:lipid A 4'-phosphatase
MALGHAGRPVPHPDRNAVTLRDYRHLWFPELLVVIGLALASAALFWATDLDMAAARAFYAPGSEGGDWPLAKAPPWAFFYESANLLVGVLAFVALGFLSAQALWGRLAPQRRPAVYLLLVVVVGPGLVVNGAFKDYWGRLRLAGLALVGSTLLGLTMGLGRMVGGAHFLSDVLWAGYLTFLVAWALYWDARVRVDAGGEAALTLKTSTDRKSDCTTETFQIS